MIDNNLLKKAIKIYGKEQQIRMVIEECGELIVAIVQWQRGRKVELDVVEETADVIIMLEQMSQIIGKEKVDKIIKEKMDRLRIRLSKYDLIEG